MVVELPKDGTIRDDLTNCVQLQPEICWSPMVSERCVQDLGPYSQMSSLSMFLMGFPSHLAESDFPEEHEKICRTQGFIEDFILFLDLSGFVGLDSLKIFCRLWSSALMPKTRSHRSSPAWLRWEIPTMSSTSSSLTMLLILVSASVVDHFWKLESHARDRPWKTDAGAVASRTDTLHHLSSENKHLHIPAC